MDKVVFVLLHFISIFIKRRSFARPEQTLSILFYCSLMLCDDAMNEHMKKKKEWYSWSLCPMTSNKQTRQKLTKGWTNIITTLENENVLLSSRVPSALLFEMLVFALVTWRWCYIRKTNKFCWSGDEFESLIAIECPSRAYWYLVLLGDASAS